jgi:hypothetical protein
VLRQLWTPRVIVEHVDQRCEQLQALGIEIELA